MFKMTWLSRLVHALLYVYVCTYRHTPRKHAPHRLVKTELTPGLLQQAQQWMRVFFALARRTGHGCSWRRQPPGCNGLALHLLQALTLELKLTSCSVYLASQQQMNHFSDGGCVSGCGTVLVLGDKTDYKYHCKCSCCSVQCQQLTELHFSLNQLLFFSYYYDYSY